MNLYANSIANFHESMKGRYLNDYLVDEYEKRSNKKVSPIQRLQWKYILNNLNHLLSADWINPDCGIRIDLCINSLQSRLIMIFASKNEAGTSVVSMLDMPVWEHVKASETDDMVICDDGDGLGEKEMIHPSYQILAYAYYLSKGHEILDIEFIPATYLFECVLRPEYDLRINDHPELLSLSPIFYADEEEELYARIRPALTGGKGLETLAKLNEFSKAPMNREGNFLFEEQKVVTDSLKHTLASKGDALYLVESMNGSGRSVVANHARLCADECGAKLTVMDMNNFDPSKLPSGGCVLCFYRPNTSPALLEKAKVMAREKKAKVYSYALSMNVGISDEGRGIAFLSKLLQLGSENPYWDPSQYSITIVNSADLLPQEQDVSSVIIPKSISYQPETDTVSGTVEEKQQIINAISEGTVGTCLFPEDEALKVYLETKIDGAKRKDDWFSIFCQSIENEDERLNEARTILHTNALLRDAYSKAIIGRIGEENWNKITEESQTWLISGLIAYDKLKNFDQMLDFSGVCVQLCKVVECEMGARHHKSFLDFEKEKFGDDLMKKIPYELLVKDRKGELTDRLCDPARYSLGNSRYLIGLTGTGTVLNNYSWREFEDYAKQRLLLDPEDAFHIMTLHVSYIEDIRVKYRNVSAHKSHVDIALARACIESILGAGNCLGIILSAYRF